MEIHKKNVEQQKMECLNQLFNCFDPGSCKQKIEDVFCDYMESESIINIEGKSRSSLTSFIMKLSNFFAACEQIRADNEKLIQPTKINN